MSWDPTTLTVEGWGRLQLVTAGKDVTFFRGVPVQILQYGSSEPFGDDVAVFRFPQITPFEHISSGLISWLHSGANIDLKVITPAGVRRVIFAGQIMSTEGHQDEQTAWLDLHCKGALYDADNGVRQPSFDYRERDIGDVIAETFNGYRGRGIGHCQAVKTGIPTRQRGAWTPNVTGFVQDLLGTATTFDGNQITVRQAYRTPVIDKKDITTVHATLSTGTPGLTVDLSSDLTSAPNVIYGEGVSPDGQHWRNSKYPNFHPDDTPAFPLTTGSTFTPGSGTGGFAVFADELRQNGYNTIVSGDTYAAADEDEVKDAQKRAGITVDGVVGAQTWNAIFETGSNVGSLTGCYYAPLAFDTRVEPYKYNARGASIGKNPAYDPTIPRIERYENYGEGVTKQQGIQSARAELARIASAGHQGELVLRIDPEEMSRWDLRAGMNVLLKNYQGADRMLHVANVNAVPRDSLAVTLTVDTNNRDLITIAAIRARNTDASTDPVRRSLPQRRKSRQTQDNKIVWDSESGAGIIPQHNLQGGFWTVLRIPAGQVGNVVRTHYITSSPAAKFAVAVFGKPVTAADLIRLVGANPLAVADPWSNYSDALVGAGFLVAWGDMNQAMGYGSSTQDTAGSTLTGEFDERFPWPYESQRPPWLWVAEYSNTSCKIAGHLYSEPDA